MDMDIAAVLACAFAAFWVSREIGRVFPDRGTESIWLGWLGCSSRQGWRLLLFNGHSSKLIVTCRLLDRSEKIKT